MESQENYDAIVNLAVSMAKVTTRENVILGTWLPFTLLYDEMVRRKEIEPIRSLTIEKKREYWNETNTGDKQYKRIFIVQALYVFDLITKDND